MEMEFWDEVKREQIMPCFSSTKFKLIIVLEAFLSINLHKIALSHVIAFLCWPSNDFSLIFFFFSQAGKR